MCSRGRLTGDIREEFFFTLTSLSTNQDTPNTGVLHYTGDMLVNFDHGDVLFQEIGAFDAVPNSTGDVAAVSTVVSGSGHYAGATGRLRIQGTFTPTDGGHSKYEGEFCK